MKKLIQIYRESKEDYIDYGRVNLRRKYTHFNQRLFNGELPIIPIKFSKAKKFSGKTVAKLRRGVVQDISMKISNIFRMTEDEFDGVFVHEMIHVYFLSKNNYLEQHGLMFRSKVGELEKKVPFEIPLKHNVTDSAFNDVAVKAKKVGAMIIDKGNEFSISFFSLTTLMGNLDKIESDIKFQKERGYFKSAVRLVECNTLLVYKYPVKRKYSNLYSLKFYKIEKEEVSELLKNGRVIRTFN